MSKLSDALDVIQNYVGDNKFKKSVQTLWEPISSAKKDGRYLLVTWLETWSNYPHIEVCCFEGNAWRYVYDGDMPDHEPTHWMPLPEPPVMEE